MTNLSSSWISPPVRFSTDPGLDLLRLRCQLWSDQQTGDRKNLWGPSHERAAGTETQSPPREFLFTLSHQCRWCLVFTHCPMVFSYRVLICFWVFEFENMRAFKIWFFFNPEHILLFSFTDWQEDWLPQARHLPGLWYPCQRVDLYCFLPVVRQRGTTQQFQTITTFHWCFPDYLPFENWPLVSLFAGCDHL